MSIEIKRTHYSNGNIRSEDPYLGGVLHGISKGWDECGGRYYEIPYKNGKINGTEKWWYRNGIVSCVISRKNDQRHGIYKWHSESKKTEYEEYFLYDARVTQEEYRKHMLIEKLSGLIS